jgi:hypothetical protein
MVPAKRSRSKDLQLQRVPPPLAQAREGLIPSIEGRSGRHLRRDALPEHTRYTDSGCDLHPSCLTCPLKRCRYDEPGGARKLLSEARDRRILALSRRGGLTIEAIARRCAVSRRTVFRVLARARGSGG